MHPCIICFDRLTAGVPLQCGHGTGAHAFCVACIAAVYRCAGYRADAVGYTLRAPLAGVSCPYCRQALRPRAREAVAVQMAMLGLNAPHILDLWPLALTEADLYELVDFVLDEAARS